MPSFYALNLSMQNLTLGKSMFPETGRRWKTQSYAPHTPASYSTRENSQFHATGSIRKIGFYMPNTTGLNSSNSLETFPEEDYLAYLEAIVHLNPDDEIAPRLLERFRKAKADGIPFKEVKTDDIVPPKEEEEDE